MKSLHYVIAHCDQAYLNERELSNGVRIVTNTSIESVEHLNRIGTVKAAPKGTVLKEGDEIIMHHNIVRKRARTAGDRIDSDYLVGPKEYFVPLDLIFAYRRDGGDWEALEPFFFVKPIRTEEKVLNSGIIIPNLKKYVSREAELWFLNRELREWGLKKGDIVGYDKNQEYKFEIDGEELYRVRMPKLLYKKC